MWCATSTRNSHVVLTILNCMALTNCHKFPKVITIPYEYMIIRVANMGWDILHARTRHLSSIHLGTMSSIKISITWPSNKFAVKLNNGDCEIEKLLQMCLSFNETRSPGTRHAHS